MAREMEVLEENLVHHKSHVALNGIESPRWETGD
jgi:hypothetical protein